MLSNKVIAIPETRQLDVFAGLLERRGATVRRCPLVSIKDAPDSEPVVSWLRDFIKSPPQLLVLFTGEGLSRLLQAAERAKLRESFVAALEVVSILSRGPKPAKVLRALSLKPAHFARPATTDGVIAALETLDINGKEVAVQLYGSEPNEKLMQYLESRSVVVTAVAPYIYANEADDKDVKQLIQDLNDGCVDLIAFTSKTQVERLVRVAEKSKLQTQLQSGLRTTTIAAVGPVVAQQLEDMDVDVAISPSDRYFLKPLVQEIVAHLGPQKP